MDDRNRCNWVTDPVLSAYHDEEWGQLPTTDNRWFECLILETFQAGLSWKTILNKRQGFRSAYAGFVVDKVASFGEQEVDKLLGDPGIVRNRRKIHASIENARVAQEKIAQYGSLDAYFRSFLSKTEDLLRELQTSFRAVGPVTAESIAIATGLMAAPHDEHCWKHHEDARKIAHNTQS
ncbi:MAG: hypothetical protein A2201_12500 [Alicyclobacillus sp. RIFOXYA1_FULL_53_8]|nr:MAG: hypothetical protein A2201_12500 [Alicyclobacillus sp. RIFOXYA1_FULL_53_8]